MDFLEIIKVVVLGVVEGITEWLPISSTGHMILIDEFINLNVSAAFKEMFLVVIQLGAILAVVVIYWRKLIPVEVVSVTSPLAGEGGVRGHCAFVVFISSFFKRNTSIATPHPLASQVPLPQGARKKIQIQINTQTISMWVKILVSCLPAAIVGVLWDDELNALFYNYKTVAIMLIIIGIAFIIIENFHKGKQSKINSIAQITYYVAFMIGIFQLVSAVFPGTSRSGATILGGLMLGVSRTVAAEYTFFLAIPVMFGASALKIVKFGFNFTSIELITLTIGMVVAFVVSIIAIKFLVSYVKKHDFKIFGYYRIVLGIVVLILL